MPEEKKQFEYIVCPVCEGSAKNNFGLACPHCGGKAYGTFFRNRFFYWGPIMGLAVIELNHVRQKFHFALNLITYAIGLSGLMALGFWVYGAGQDLADPYAFAFWREQNALIFIFWLSLLADMFVVYRMSEEERKSHKIKSLKFIDKNKNIKIPENWDDIKNSKSNFIIDVSGGYSPEAYKTIENAYLLAKKLDHPYVSPIHLLFSCLEDETVAALFSRLNADSKMLTERLKSQLMKMNQANQKTVLSKEIKRVLIQSYIDTGNLGRKKVSPMNMIIPCIDNDEIIKEILYDMEIDRNKVQNVLLWFIINERLIENYEIYKKKARFKPGTGMNRAYTAIATPILDHMGYDLTIAAKWGRLDFCVSRDNEIEKIFQVLESGKSGVILTGPDGVGKNAIVDGIAQLMVKEDVPSFLADKRLVEIDTTRLIAGAAPGQAEARMLALIDEVVKSGNVVLFINNIENIIGITSGEQQSLDLSEVLSVNMEKRNLICLASATDENYTKYIEGQSVGEAFERLKVEEPKGNQAIQIIESKIGHLEGKYKVYFSYDAIERVVIVSDKYIHDKYLPKKAIDILELVAIKTLKKRGRQSLVTQDDISEVIGEMTGIPVTKISESEGKTLLQLEERIHERMISQEEAVKMVSASLRRARTELREGTRPISSFLFLGPTGVGKTELAKAVSEVYFGDEKYMIRIDMSEYQHQASVHKMIGNSEGGRGYLTEAVRKSPFSLVLLDEVEKAHPDILNLFLQVMDDGRLTDGQGRTIDFTNSIIIATSNAGAEFIQREIHDGTPVEQIKSELINNHLNKVMRPELINRFDGIIVFEPLSMENVVDISRLMLNKIDKMLQAKGIGMYAHEEGIRKLASEGYDPKFGARPLRRLLQDKVEDQIANKILSGDLKRRDTVVITDEAGVEVEKAKEL
jgi:ATP-dependent Clp protease ATP-binding subunit ClpC